MTVSAHKATIGRVVWVWVPDLNGVLDPEQAFTAQVHYVHPDGSVDVIATTHTGASFALTALEVHDPSTNKHGMLQSSAYATWMPYQKQQMDVAGTNKQPDVATSGAKS
jgi:hypothetical protein